MYENAGALFFFPLLLSYEYYIMTFISMTIFDIYIVILP